MQSYEVRRGHRKKVDLEALFKECFGAARREGDWLTGSFGAMRLCKARFDGEALVVETDTDKGAPPERALETLRAWNRFLEGATGFNSKQRGERLQKAAKKGEA